MNNPRNFCKRLLAAALAGVLVIPAGALEGSDLSDVVPDPVLRALINQTLSTPDAPRADDLPISAADMALLEGSDAAEIDAADDESLFALKGLCSDEMDYIEQDPVSLNPSHGIRSLEGMQYAVNLRSLDLSENTISDLTPLSGLEKLTYLELDRNHISDLEPLGSLVGLEHLNLYNNDITDITPLSTLTNVNWFDLHYANRGAAHLPIDTLADMTSLEYISIESNDLYNEDLSALADLEHLNYIKLNANHITDLTPISPYLEKIMQGESCRIEANNQSLPDWERPLVQADPAGGEITLEIPPVSGLDALEMPTDLPIFPEAQAAMAQDVEGVSVSLEPSGALFTFDPRTYGVPLQEEGELELTYAVTAFDMDTFEEIMPFIYTLYLLVSLRQDARYQAALDTPNGSSFFSIDTAAGETLSPPLTIQLTDVSGVPVSLAEVRSIQFYVANKAEPKEVEGLVPQDVHVEGNTISFRVALTDSALFSGAQYLTPVVTYLRTGSTEEETIARDTLTFHLFAGDAASFQVDETICFDLAAGKDGSLSSLPVQISIPGETVSFANLQDASGYMLCSGRKQEDGRFLFTLDASQIESVARLYIGASEFLFPPVTTKLVYSAPVDGVSVDALEDGTRSAPRIRWQGALLDNKQTLTLTSADPSILSVEGGQLVAHRSGKTELTIQGLRIPMEWNGVTYSDVELLQPVTVPVTVYETSGGSSTQKYTISAQAGVGGSISPDGKVRVERGDSKTFTITADTGYEIADVQVDGVSVGKVQRYTFEQVRSAHTISASFQKIGQSGSSTMHFSDVSADAWYAEAVAYAAQYGLMQGTSDQTFSPELPLTRSMMVQMLYQLAGQPAAGDSSSLPFADVAGDAWYLPALRWAYSEGFVSGYSSAQFAPNDPITREQFAVLLGRYASSQGMTLSGGSLSSFQDSASISSWAADSLKWACGEGILSGKSASHLDPQGQTSRAEAAQMLMKFHMLLSR